MIKLKYLLEAKKKSNHTELFDLNDVLLYGLIAYLSNNKIYVSSKKAKENMIQSTAEIAKEFMENPDSIPSRLEGQAKSILSDLEKWLKTKNFSSEKNNNPSMREYYDILWQISVSGIVLQKYFGYAVSLISLYFNEKTTNERISNNKSTYVGDINKKLNTYVVFKNLKTINSVYGESVLVNMNDLDGNALIWFAKPKEITHEMYYSKSEDVPMYIEAIVTKHEISKFTKLPETTIKMVKILKTPSE